MRTGKLFSCRCFWIPVFFSFCSKRLLKCLKLKMSKMTNSYFATPLVWSSTLKLLFLHLSLIGVPFVLPFAKNATIVFDYLLLLVAVLGIQIGAHRLWTHRSFKASFELRILLAISQTISLQNDIYEWVRDHRSKLFFL